MSRPPRCAKIITLIFSISICSATASAKDDSGDTYNDTDRMLTSTSNATTSTFDNLDRLVSSTIAGFVTTIGGVVTTIYFLIQNAADKNDVALRAYILHERESLMAAHAVGGGDAVDDMATMLWIPAEHRALLGASMRQRRAALDAVLAQTCQDAATCDALADRYLATLIAAIHARPEAHEPITLSP
jgi:hypothetical protein